MTDQIEPDVREVLQIYDENFPLRELSPSEINIRDNRILYNNVTLVSYQQKDPIFQAQKELFEIRQEKQKLIRELQILKNVR